MTGSSIQTAISGGGPIEIALKIGTSPFVLGGFACFALSLLLWLFVLSRIPLSSAYPFVALGILVTVSAGILIFDEPISLAKAIGVGLIVSGVILVGSA